jgi:hypothetical protein
MRKVISIHEYELRPDIKASEFQHALQLAEDQNLFHIPGLVGHHFIKGLKGSRIGKFAAIWVYENRGAWEELWGTPDRPKDKIEYPDNWQKWEKLLEPFLELDPDEILFTAYEVI